MAFAQTVRRLHLYLGLALLPWILMYGVSSGVFAHIGFFNSRDEASGRPQWTVREERGYDAPVPEGPEALRAFGRQLMVELKIERPLIYTSRPNRGTVRVNGNSFLKRTRVVYAIAEKKLTVEDRRFRFDQFLLGLHARGGFRQDGLLQDAWGVIVDVVCVAFLLFIATGYYMWWRIAPHRNWGWVAILAGVATFAGFTLGL